MKEHRTVAATRETKGNAGARACGFVGCHADGLNTFWSDWAGMTHIGVLTVLLRYGLMWVFVSRNRLTASCVYKVGHYGSRNATPKSLWGLHERIWKEKASE